MNLNVIRIYSVFCNDFKEVTKETENGTFFKILVKHYTADFLFLVIRNVQNIYSQSG